MNPLIRSRIQQGKFNRTPEEVLKFIIYELKKEVDSLKSQVACFETKLERSQSELKLADYVLGDAGYSKCNQCLTWNACHRVTVCDICSFQCCEDCQGDYKFSDCANCSCTFCSTHSHTQNCPDCGDG